MNPHEAFFVDGKKYLSSKEVALQYRFSHDYVGQLCREGRVRSKRVGRSWYVDEDSVKEYITFTEVKNQQKNSQEIPVPKKVPAVTAITYGPKLKSESFVEVQTSIPLAKHQPEHRLQVVLAALLVVFGLTLSGVVLMHSAPFQNGTEDVGAVEQAVLSTRELFASLYNEVVAVTTFFQDYISYAFGYAEADTNPDDPVPRSNSPSPPDGNGMVVVPAAEDRQDQIKKIEGSFSDQVKVILDESGTSGIITPEFKNKNPEKYLYVMVPIDEEEQNDN